MDHQEIRLGAGGSPLAPQGAGDSCTIPHRWMQHSAEPPGGPGDLGLTAREHACRRFGVTPQQRHHTGKLRPTPLLRR